MGGFMVNGVLAYRPSMVPTMSLGYTLKTYQPKWPDAKWAVIHRAGRYMSNDNPALYVIDEDGYNGRVKGRHVLRWLKHMSERDKWQVFTSAPLRSLAMVTPSAEGWTLHRWRQAYTRYTYDYPKLDVFPFRVDIAVEPMLRWRTASEVYQGMTDYAAWARRYAGALGKASYVAKHTIARTLDDDVTVRTYGRPPDALFGGRKEAYEPGPHEGIEYLDLTAAYPWALADTSIPEKIARVPKIKADFDGDGIAVATVDVPFDSWPYPLPSRVGRDAVTYGYGDGIRGAWTYADLRNAERQGCTIDVEAAWETQGVRAGLLDGWLSGAVTAARSLDGLGGAMAKRATNVAWSMFGMRGKLWTQEFRGDVPSRLTVVSQSGTIDLHTRWLSALVSGRIRERLAEVLPDAIYCDTDGAMLPAGGGSGGNALGEGHPLPGDWRVKDRMHEVEIWGAQSYRWFDGSDWRYVVAGLNEHLAEARFLAKLPMDRAVPGTTMKMDISVMGGDGGLPIR